MSRHTIVTMPGDGIGKIVLQQAINVLDAAGFEADYIHADIGWEFWKREGDPLPEETINLLKKYKVGLFGAITSKSETEAQNELNPQLQGKGYVYYSPIVTLRQKFDLDICIRPCRSFLGNPLNFIRRDKKDEIYEPKIDVVIFRQNTEDLYSGVEWSNPPKIVRSALETHPQFKAFTDTPNDELAITCRIFTKEACERIVKEGFTYARNYGYNSVTIAEKPNILRKTSGMMLECAKRIQEEFPEIELWNINIDSLMMWLTKEPEKFGVIVAGNLFGDIISDAFAGVVGGLGFASSANLGKDVAIFEPVHGSAPECEKFAPSIVNPIAMILSACMMLDYLGERDKSQRIVKAVEKVIVEKEFLTYDMLNLQSSPDVIKAGAASTERMTEAIINKL